MTIDRLFKSSRVLPARALLLVRRVSLLRSWHQAHTVIKGLAGLENHRGARRSVAIQVAVFEGPRSSCEKALFTGEWGPVCLTLDLIRTASQPFTGNSCHARIVGSLFVTVAGCYCWIWALQYAPGLIYWVHEADAVCSCPTCSSVHAHRAVSPIKDGPASRPHRKPSAYDRPACCPPSRCASPDFRISDGGRS